MGLYVFVSQLKNNVSLYRERVDKERKKYKTTITINYYNVESTTSLPNNTIR